MQIHSLPKLPNNLQILNYVLSALKVFGECSLTSGVGLNASHKSNWISRGTLECLPGVVLGLFIWFIVITHLALANCFIFGPGMRQTFTEAENRLLSNPSIDENMKTANISICRMIIACLALERMVHILFGWTDKEKLASLMKNWAQLRSMTRSLVLCRQKEIKESVLYYIIVGMGTVHICIMAVVNSVVFIRACTEAGCQQVTVQVLFCLYIAIAVLQDLKAALIFHQLANDFKQVRMEMDSVTNLKNLSSDNVRAWRHAVMLTRRQTCAAAECLAIPELAMLLQTILVGLGTIFIAIYNVWGSEAIPIQDDCVCIAVGLLARLFIKTVLAEKITKEEARIVHDLMDLHVTDDLVRLEIKDLQDIILQSPTDINLANIVVLRRKLCLGVISQIVTYLIVLIQFYGRESEGFSQ